MGPVSVRRDKDTEGEDDPKEMTRIMGLVVHPGNEY